MPATSSAASADHDSSPLQRSAMMRRQSPLIGGFLLLLAVAVGSIWLAVGNHRFNEAVAHTLQVRSDAYRLLTLMQDAESGQRGYLLTGNPAYLRPYLIGSSEAPAAAERLQVLVASSEVQTASMSKMRQLIAQKLAELARTVALRKNGEAEAALKIVNDDSGNTYMEQFRAEIQRVENEEVRIQDEQSASVQFNDTLLAGASLVGIAIFFAVAGYTILSSTRATQSLIDAQDALRRTNENLEAIVAERVADLQAANDEIQRFAYIVSHDLRAPLVNVMGFTSELEAARADIASFLKEIERQTPVLVTAEVRAAIETDLPEALGFIRTSTAKMDRLINAILKLSREGRRVLTPQKIDVGDLVRSQGESLSQQMASAAATLTVQDDLPEIVSDRLAVEQILGNLIENAVKYLAPGRPGRISVTGKTQGAYVRYTIADNGRGIDAKDYERIFELFRRSGEQDKPGEGIGLAYVRNLARRLGGNVAVQSELGQGSTFTVILPSVFSAKKDAAA